MRLSATRLTSIAQAGGGRTLIQRVISILRRFGTDAHVYLPGVGMLNGLQAGNHLDSAGTTDAEIDGPVGLVLDAAGSLGVELVVNGDFSAGTTGWSAGSGSVLSSAAGVITVSLVGGDTYGNANQLINLVVGKTYQYTAKVVSQSVGSASSGISTTATGGIDVYAASGGVGDKSAFFTATTTTAYIQLQAVSGANAVTEFSKVSVREVTGIAASQPTTANKSVLKLTNGRYNWLFDSTDLLTATYPAGYESVTVIDARSTGQVTTAGANIVGAYSMGPSVTLYGRMIVKGVVPPSDLALLQSFANRLAGL